MNSERRARGGPGALKPMIEMKNYRMGLAERLVIGSTVVVAGVMLLYGATSLRQRNAMIGAAVARETAALGQTAQIVANSALRNNRIDNLDRVLRRMLTEPELEVGAVIDASGVVIAGGASDTACLPGLVATAIAEGAAQRWDECAGGVRAAILPVESPAAWLLLARRTTALNYDRARARQEILLTTLALILFASVAIVLILRTTLARPLSGIMVGVRGLGGPGVPSRIEVPRSARELEELANAFNEMVDRLEGKRLKLISETKERVELEKRLRGAEVFAAIGRLSGGLAHELGSPLGVIGMRAEEIENDPSCPPAVREHTRAITEEVDRIARLVRDLLHVGHKRGFTSAPVDLRDVAEAVREGIAIEANGARIAVQLHAPPDPVMVSGDPVLLRHAVNNVAVNSVQAMRGVERDRILSISVLRQGASARISIVDSGPGIEDKNLSAVTQPFFTTKDVGEGTGLGLAITAGIIAEHGGELKMESSDRGLRVDIELPAATVGSGV